MSEEPDSESWGAKTGIQAFNSGPQSLFCVCHPQIWKILLIMRISLLQSANMNLMDITKIFSLLQPDKEEEDTDTGEKQALNQAVYNNDSYALDQLLCQERYKRFINSRSGWGVPGTPLRLAASSGHRSLDSKSFAGRIPKQPMSPAALRALFTLIMWL